MPVASNGLTTLADLKSYLGITYSDDDTLLENLINQATVIMENYCKRGFKDTGALTEYFNGNPDGKITPRQYPINSITSVAYASGTLDAPTWNIMPATTGYIADAYGNTLNVANMYIGIRNYRVIYRGGFVTIPQDLVFACHMLIGNYYSRRDSNGASNESVGGASVGWIDDIPKAIRVIIDKYRRFTF